MISFITKVIRINKDRLLACNFGRLANSPGKHNERTKQKMAYPHLCHLSFFQKPFVMSTKKINLDNRCGDLECLPCVMKPSLYSVYVY